ncbi:MAG: glycosyltransferase family 4 protein [Bacteroidales bacterium]|nr:glycosyltransferase family 4 protein [Lachnoclostridium sp.]MCM1384126.1 glycosyltransferase family 4 protein [Lachnoclostridium sp.]MCM1465686.1 glycosyltransferase family 4 protein [Bacteroidales bacterium]
MKICIVGAGNETGTRSWTDVAITIQKSMVKRGREVEYYRWQGKIRHKYINKVKRLLGRIFYLPASLRDPGMYMINAKLFKNLLKDNQSDCFLFMGEHCLSSQITEKSRCYAYIDAIRSPLAKVSDPDKLGLELYFKYYNRNDAKSLNVCEKIFTQNEWSRQCLLNIYKIAPQKVINVGFGIYTPFFEGKKEYTNHKMLIVLRKGLERVKGLDLLIEGFIIAKKKIFDLQLDVVGTEYKKYEGIHYYYNQPREVTLQLFIEDSLYAMPALFESNGITYLEALANKMPILGLNRFAFPEFSGNGKYGFIVDDESPKKIAETIISAFQDTEKMRIMGEEGQKFVRSKYNWDLVVESMLENMTVLSERR